MRNSPIRFILPALVLAALPMTSFAYVSVGVSINIAPPALPVYVQPPCPAVGYIWTPGYWAWDDGDYYWVPGTWVLAPARGVLWTPGYWGWASGLYIWHAGYWGPHVGFYGGVNYGFGYVGSGYEGGYWRGDRFFYNRSVTNISNTNITNVYNKTVVNNVTVNRVSYNGGTGGTIAQPTATQLTAAREPHVPVTTMQRQHEQAAATNRALRASVNGGKPAVAATPKPGVFSGRGVVAAREAGGPTHASAIQNYRADRPPQAQHEAAARATRVGDGGGESHSNRPPVQHGAEPHGLAGTHDRPHASPEPHSGPAPAQRASVAQYQSRAAPRQQARTGPPVRNPAERGDDRGRK